MFDCSSCAKLIVGGGALAPCILFVAGLALAIFWLYQFVQLMLLEDSLFPGCFDKALWVAVFVFVFPLAPFAFLMFKGGLRAQKAGDSSGESGAR